MQIPVLIQPVPGNGYRASCGEPFAVTTEGATPEEALTRFKECVTAKMRNGASIALIEIQTGEHPWRQFAGMFEESDPVVGQWLNLMAQNRGTAETLE